MDFVYVVDLIYRALLFVKYCLQSIVRLFVYVVLMKGNIFITIGLIVLVY